MIIPEENGQILAVSENGYGKRTVVTEFPVKGRAGQGVIGIQTSARNGPVVGAVQVFEGDEIMLISDKGTLVRTRCDEVSSQGRATQGVRLIKLKEGESLVGVERVHEPEASELSADSEGDATESTSTDVVDSGTETPDADAGDASDVADSDE